jgi:predicted  nucleic acid-binding Zn-ribbon protein
VNILQDPQYLWWLLAGTLIGGMLVWALSSLIHRSRRLEALQTVETQLATSKVQLEDLRNQLAALHQEYDDLRKEFRLMEVAKVSAETKLIDTQQHIESQRAILDDIRHISFIGLRSLSRE